MWLPGLAESFAGKVGILDHIVSGQALDQGCVQGMIITQVGHFNHITTHELATKGVNHVVVVERDEQGITIQEQAKLCEIKIYVLRAVYTAHDKHIRIIYSIAVFQQQQVLDEQGICRRIIGQGGIVVAVVLASTLRTQIFVDVEVKPAHGVLFADYPIQILVVIGPVGAVKAESRHSIVFMGQIDQKAKTLYNYEHG